MVVLNSIHVLTLLNDMDYSMMR